MFYQNDSFQRNMSKILWNYFTYICEPFMFNKGIFLKEILEIFKFGITCPKSDVPTTKRVHSQIWNNFYRVRFWWKKSSTWKSQFWIKII